MLLFVIFSHLRSWPHSVQVTFIMRALIINRCSPSLATDNTFKSNLDMHLHLNENHHQSSLL